jgi:lambda family phage tail tape measure protein
MKAGTVVIDIDAGTAKFLVDIAGANAQLKTLDKTAKETGAHGVSQMQASSAAAREFGGALPIRAAERFLATTLGLGPVLQKAFPLLGGIAFAGMLVDLGKKAVDAYQELQKMQAAPKRIADEFGKLDGTIARSNDELRVSNDRLDNEIAKLTGKPHNGLKLALDEAAVAADKLGDSLRSDFETLGKLLEEQNIGGLRAAMMGETSTSDLKTLVLGKDGYGGFKEEINAENRALSDQLRLLRQRVKAGGMTEKEAGDASTVARGDSDTRRLQILQRMAAAADAQVAKLEPLQAERDEYIALSAKMNSFNAVPPSDGERARFQEMRRGAAPGIPNSAADIALARTISGIAHDEMDRIDLTAGSESREKTKGGLEEKAAADSITAPYRNKLSELAATLVGLNLKLAAVGATETAQLAAKGKAIADEDIARLNAGLKEKHRAGLSPTEQSALTGAVQANVAKEAEIEWRSKIEATNDSLAERARLLDIQTAAIDAGREAQIKANVETELARVLGAKANDPEWIKAHGTDVQALRGKITPVVRAAADSASDDAVSKLGRQIELENSLAAVERQGAEAVRLVTLAYKLRDLAATNGTRAQIAAEIEHYNAERRTAGVSSLAKLEQEISATERLTAAQMQGAEAVRQVELALKDEELERENASPEVRAAAKLDEQTKHQQQVLAAALKTGMAYQNQIDSLDKEIGLLRTLQGTQADSLAVEISLRDLEKQRAKILSDQAEQLGTARDGLRTFFAEMATQGESAAKTVHDALKSAFDGLNSELARMAAGQKANWAGLFQGLSQQLMKVALQNAEAIAAAKVIGSGSAGSNGKTAGGWRGALGGVLGGLAGALGGDTKKKGPLARDGQTASRAYFVTGVTASAAGNPAPDISARPVGSPGALGGPGVGAVPFGMPGNAAPGSVPVVSSSVTYPGFGADASNGEGLSLSDLASPGGGGDAGLTADDADNLAGFDNSELSQLDNSAVGTAPDLGNDAAAGGLEDDAGSDDSDDSDDSGGGMGALASAGIGAGISLLSLLFNRKHNRHLQAGQPFFIPSFGGYRALGGAVDASQTYMVGEQGPELWTPPASGGTVISNDGWGRGGAGGSTPIYIDARGSEPQAVEQRVKQGMAVAYQGSVRTSFKAVDEFRQRRPAGSSF